MHEFASAIAQSGISVQLQEHVWIVPAFQSLHIIALAMLFFASLSIDVALLKARGAAVIQPWFGTAFRWLWIALAVLLLSGVVLIATEPVRSIMNLMFRIKLVLVLAAVAIVFLLQRHLRDGRTIGFAGRAAAVTSIILWLAIIFCGRFIAYFGDLTS